MFTDEDRELLHSYLACHVTLSFPKLALATAIFYMFVSGV